MRVRPASPNFRTALAAQIAAIAPEAMADGRIDFEALRGLLDDDAAGPMERFGLLWPGKREAQRLAQTPTTATLEPDRENSRDWETTQNVVIEGDNLEVLKVLQRHYFGQIKMIYIDPPYNTGKDFVYSDDYRDGVGHYLEWTEQVTESGKTSTNVDTAGRFHSNWLNMMYPRLKLARNLLTEDGVLLISINNVEQANLRTLCDEIFGTSNLIEQFVWINEGNVDQQSKIKGIHEYILAYCKNLTLLPSPSTIDPNISPESKLYREYIENSITKNGPANPSSQIHLPAGFPASFSEGRIEENFAQFPYIHSDIIVSDNQTQNSVVIESGWSSKNLLERFIDNEFSPILDTQGRETWFEIRESGAIYMLKKRSAAQGHVLSALRNLGTTKQNSSALARLGIHFSYPKPLGLVKYLASVFTRPIKETLILDFFAGSGTTAHAVMQLNAEDGGNRRCISVQLPEPTPLDSPAREAGFDTISQITRERIRRAGDKILNDQSAQLATRSTPLDVGFRAYRLSDTHFRKWALNSDISAEELNAQLALAYDSAEDTATPEQLFTEVALKHGLSLTESYKTTTIAGLEMFSIEEGLILGYFNEHVTPTLEQLREVIDTHPGQLFMLEDVFSGHDELKANLAQLCSSRGVELLIA